MNRNNNQNRFCAFYVIEIALIYIFLIFLQRFILALKKIFNDYKDCLNLILNKILLVNG